MRILRVGDPHVKPSNLAESEKLMEYVYSLAPTVDRIEILGDLFHTHAILRLEVIEFWDKWLRRLSDAVETVVLEGNHDRSGDYNNSYSALTLFARLGKANLKIITEPTLLGDILYVPYLHDSEKFISTCNGFESAKVIVCHQTFNGSKFENGFYAPDGIDANRLSCSVIFSGHIHARQQFGKVTYPGTARWDSVSDANQIKGLSIYTHGDAITEEFFPTDTVCQPILSFQFKEGDAGMPAWPEGSRVAIELVGSSSWVKERKEELKGKCAIKTKITDTRKTVARKVNPDFLEFLKTVTTNYDLVAYAKEIGLV